MEPASFRLRDLFRVADADGSALALRHVVYQELLAAECLPSPQGRDAALAAALHPRLTEEIREFLHLRSQATSLPRTTGSKDDCVVPAGVYLVGPGHHLLLRRGRGGPLSESLYGRIWHQARAAAMPEDGTGTQPVRRPCDLRHAALSLWLASGAPPAEIAAAPGTACVSCSPSTPTAFPAATRSPASRSRKPSGPANGPPLAHKKRRRRRESCPSCVRATAGLNGTQLDLKPPPRSG